MLAFIITAVVVALDQISKILIRNSLEIGERADFIPYILGLTRSENSGASFGILKDSRWVFLVISSVAIIAMLVLLIYHYRSPRDKRRNSLFVVSVSFVLGGGIGNMIDRLFVEGSKGINVVTDMFEVLFFDFAIFNVADSFICIGAVLICIYVIFFENEFEKRQNGGQNGTADF